MTGTERLLERHDTMPSEVLEPLANDGLTLHVAVTDMHAATQGMLFEITSRCVTERKSTKVLLSATPALDGFAERLGSAGVGVHRFGRGYDPGSDHMRSFAEARELFRLLGPRLLHFHGRWAPGAWDAVLAARAAGVRTILRTEQDPVPSLLVQRHRTKLRIVNTAVAHVVFVSRGAAQMHLTSGCEWFKNWSIVPNGVPLEAVDPSTRERARASLGLAPQGMAAVLIGHTEAKNGPLDFVRAAGAAVRKGSALRFIVAGNDSFRLEAEEIAGAVGIRDRIHFLDAPDVSALQFGCDIRVYEGPSGALLEGLAASFASRHRHGRGGAGDSVSRNAAIVCKPCDVLGMARGLLALETEEGNQRRFASSVDPAQFSKLSYEAVHQEYVNLYATFGLSRLSGEMKCPVPSSPMRVLD
jgi:hypothetical protein